MSRPVLSERQCLALGKVLEPLDGLAVRYLRKIAVTLKQDFGGEGWAIGEVVDRWCNDQEKESNEGPP